MIEKRIWKEYLMKKVVKDTNNRRIMITVRIYFNKIKKMFVFYKRQEVIANKVIEQSFFIKKESQKKNNQQNH